MTRSDELSSEGVVLQLARANSSVAHLRLIWNPLMLDRRLYVDREQDRDVSCHDNRPNRDAES